MQVDVSIHVAGGESALVTFQGIGYDPHITGDTARFDTVSSPLVTPGSSKLTLPGQVNARGSRTSSRAPARVGGDGPGPMEGIGAQPLCSGLTWGQGPLPP